MTRGGRYAHLQDFPRLFWRILNLLAQKCLNRFSRTRAQYQTVTGGSRPNTGRWTQHNRCLEAAIPGLR